MGGGEQALARNSELLAKCIKPVLEVIRPRMDFVSAVRLEQFGDPRSATAAADHPELDLALGSLGQGHAWLQGGQRRCRESGLADELAAFQGIRCGA